MIINIRMDNFTSAGTMAASASQADSSVDQLSPTQLGFLIAYSITAAIAVITLSLRIYTRLCINKSFGLDDVMVILAMGFSAWFFQTSANMFQFGFGRHLLEVDSSQLEGYMKHLVTLVVTYALAPACTKISIILLLWRIIPKRGFRIALAGTAFTVFAYTLVISVVIAYPCNPVTTSRPECLVQCGLWQAILNIVTDIMILILPLHMVYHLNLPLRQKLMLGSIFSTGIFVIVICFVRITYVMSLKDNPDVTYSQGRAAIWSSIEINIGIVCNTVSVVKPALRKFFPGLFADDNRPVLEPAKPRPRPQLQLFYSWSGSNEVTETRSRDQVQLMTTHFDKSEMDGSDTATMFSKYISQDSPNKSFGTQSSPGRSLTDRRQDSPAGNPRDYLQWGPSPTKKLSTRLHGSPGGSTDSTRTIIHPSVSDGDMKSSV